MSTPAAPANPTSPIVLKISPMAHVAVGFLLLGLLALVFAEPTWFAPLLVLPVLASTAIFRFRTSADRDGFTARSLVSSTSAAWEDVDGLKFDRGSWAVAVLKDGAEVRLPAVTFATLPSLTAVTAGRVPNPYAVDPEPETDPEAG